VSAWKTAYALAGETLRSALVAAQLGDKAEPIVLAQLATTLEEIVRLDPLLAAPLAAAGLRPWPEGLQRSHRAIAQERVRRSVSDRAETGARKVGGASTTTCFRSDPKFGVQPPVVFADFDSSHWEALEAPWAAALRTMDKVTLSETQLFRVRAAMAEDPAHFAESYAAFLHEFAS
jgi:hypothetical protein